MLIKVIGRVTWVEPGGGAFYINDGSGIWDGTRDETHGPVYGMQVVCPDEITPPARGAFVAVTGIFQPNYTDLELPCQEMILMKRSIRRRSNEDIQVILAP